MKIHEVEEQVGITKKNIRFYEHEGLLSPRRSENGYRNYSEEDVAELKKVKLLRSLSFPLEEIRKMQRRELTVEDGARRHIIALEREKDTLEKSRRLCEELQEHRETLQTLDADYYLEKMQSMEKEGVVFMNIKKNDRRKAYVAPAVAAAVIILFVAATIFLILSEAAAERMRMAELVFIAAVVLILLSVIVGILFALRERIKQIKGGEEDAAAKY